MSIKHALVVDDSRSAQFALKKQLEQHDLAVVLADSGEEALELLKHQVVDVIFMDHTMPGMDGLQALAAIKRNPRTATIPVMMYTTMEGEVYVGQARALGGIGVLPKEVHPQVLFDMLLKLGLVKDKRAAAAPTALPTPVIPDWSVPQRRSTDQNVDRQTRTEPPGFALAALVNRIIEDQAALREELREERARLAHGVAAEVIEAQQSAHLPSATPPAPPASRIWIALTAFFTATTLIFALLAVNAARSSKAQTPAIGVTAQQTELSRLQGTVRAEQSTSQARYLKSIDALQWALNQHAGVPFDELPFNDARADEVRDLFERLIALDFHGRVRIESHLGEFCLVGNDAESYRLAPPDLPVEACSHIGHPLDDSAFIADRQSLGFAEFLKSSPLVNGSEIVLQLVAHDRAHSLRRVPFPSDVSVAGDWNHIAQRNNRLEFTLIPTGD